jgi:hypothetical protein
MPELSFDLLEKEVSYALSHNDIKGAFEVYNLVTEWLSRQDLKNKNRNLYNKYERYLIQFKFIALNYFNNDEDYLDLLKNHLPLALDLPGFDLWGKLRTHLISISDINERAMLKYKMKESLEKSSSSLFSKSNYKDDKIIFKVNDWIRDFIANINYNLSDAVKKAEYISNGPSLKFLNKEDRGKVLALMGIYENLVIPSNTKEGYENSVAVEIDGRKYIFNQGDIEPISKFKIIGREKENNQEKNVSKSKDIEDILVDEDLTLLEEDKTQLSDDAEINEEQIENNLSLDVLNKALANYSPSSLEYKAIKEEIARIKKRQKSS